MNDPNGLIERDGVHHLFFQHNPDEPTFGPMCWGHAVSTDLLHWSERPVALRPDTDYDADGCWSGCAVPLSDGRVAMIYSANRNGRQLPALAISTDEGLDTFAKSAANPVIDDWPVIETITDLRDHAVITEPDEWRQVLAVGRDTVDRPERSPAELSLGGRGGQLVSYRCPGEDLTRWSYDGVFLDGRQADLPGEVWECPDVFWIDDCPVVIISWYTRGEPGPDGVPAESSDVLWLTGTITDGRFTADRHGRLDLGDRFYAPQSYPAADGRRLMVGWLRTQRDPVSAGRPSVGAATLPRRLGLRDGRLTQQPADELDALVRTPLGRLGPDQPELMPGEPAAAVELVVEADMPADLAATTLELSGPGGHRYDLALDCLAAPSTWVRDGEVWALEPTTDTRARILIDHGLIEVFTVDGRAASFSDLALSTISDLRLVGDEPCAARIAVAALSAQSA